MSQHRIVPFTGSQEVLEEMERIGDDNPLNVQPGELVVTDNQRRLKIQWEQVGPVMLPNCVSEADMLALNADPDGRGVWPFDICKRTDLTPVTYFLCVTNHGALLADWFAFPASITVDTDGTLAADSDLRVASQKATKTYVDALKDYVDSLVNGLAWKPAVRVATTANITLSGAQTIDGVSVVAGNRVLVKNQTTATQNGPYICATGAWTRPPDTDTGAEFVLATFLVSEGTLGHDTQWTCTNDSVTLGSTNIVFAQISGGTSVSADGTTLQLVSGVFSVKNVNLLALAGLVGAANKLPYFTGSGAMALADFTSVAVTLLAATTQAAQRTALGLVIGTDVQAYNANLAAISALTTATYGLSLLTAANAAAARALLVLGGAALLSVGTVIGTVAAGDDPRFGPVAPGILDARDVWAYA